MWRPTRRRFLLALAATPVACSGSRDRFGGFAVGIQSWSLRAFGRADALRMAAELGAVHIELTTSGGGVTGPSHLQFPATDAEIAALREEIAASGLSCITSHVAPRDVDYELDRAAFDYAAKLGLRTIMATTWSLEARATIDALVREYDLRVGLHNHAGGEIDLIEDVRVRIDGLDERVGTIVDTGHYMRLGVDPAEAIRTFGPRVHGLHLKDVVAANEAAPDAIVGEGVIDLVSIFRALREIDAPSDCTISIEYESNVDAPFDDLVRCITNVEAAIGKL